MRSRFVSAHPAAAFALALLAIGTAISLPASAIAQPGEVEGAPA